MPSQDCCQCDDCEKKCRDPCKKRKRIYIHSAAANRKYGYGAYTQANQYGISPGYTLQSAYASQYGPVQFTYGFNPSCTCQKVPCQCFLVCKKKKSKCCDKCKVDPCCCKLVCLPPCPIVLYRLKQVNLIVTTVPRVQDFPPHVNCCPGDPPLGAANFEAGFGFATLHDSDLVNPWGMTILSGNLWVANEGTQTITVYAAATGVKQGDSISVIGQTGPQNPTGLVANTNSAAFLAPIPNTTPAQFTSANIIAVTLQAGIVGHFPVLGGSASPPVTQSLYQSPISTSSYTGAALTATNLIVANFGNGVVEIFSTLTNSSGVLNAPTLSSINPNVSNAKVPTACINAAAKGPFHDPFPIPGYAPFNVVVIGGLVFILYAKNNGLTSVGTPFVINPGSTDTSVLAPPTLDIGPGKGYINVFDTTGQFIRRFASGGPLNAPWGMVASPAGSGLPPGSYLVGNQGDGTINIYDNNGVYLGKLRSCYGSIVSIDRLWSLIPGTSGSSTNPGRLFYFSAGIFSQTQGVVGYFIPC